jgi:hypothetical protein
MFSGGFLDPQMRSDRTIPTNPCQSPGISGAFLIGKMDINCCSTAFCIFLTAAEVSYLWQAMRALHPGSIALRLTQSAGT